ncbi:MAG: DUF2256 domain-containing protein [Granulosicoccus sp.]|nr:DUF2256 domain-containing protein [Granulosicoccus sp.]
MKNPSQQTKICPVCQRPFNNRKKWQSRGLWPGIVYCSRQCRATRRHRVSDQRPHE